MDERDLRPLILSILSIHVKTHFASDHEKECGSLAITGVLLGDAVISGSMTPEELAEALNFESVAELAEYLASLDFEMMQEILETFPGS